MEEVFVTGATGLLGHNVIIELLERGYVVKALVRNSNKVYITHTNLQFIVGDINDVENLNLTNCKIFIHIAATTDQSFLHYANYYKINTLATKNLFNACVKANVKRFIYVSSANTIGFGNKKQLANETAPMCYPFTESYYAKSKQESEEFLILQQSNVEVIIVNPTFMLGSYDIKPSSGELVLMAYKKPVTFIPKGGKNFVHVKDAAVAICNAISKGKDKERYILGNTNMSFAQFYQLQKQLVGYKQVLITLPTFLLSFVGYVGNFLQWLQIRNVITKRNLEQLGIQEYYCVEKAINELELPQTPIKEAIEDSINWFKKQRKIN